jgi:4-hydroxybutyrate CoA-transferase
MEKVTAEAALARVDSGMTIAFPHLSAEPTALTEALWRRAAQVRDLTIYSGMLLTGYDFLQSPAAANFTLKTWFLPGTLLRKTAADVKAEYLPLTWAQTARFLNEVPIDIGLIQVSPADESGMHSLGLNATVARALVRNAKLVIAQVNPEVPHTLGDSLVHGSKLDLLVEGARPLAAYAPRATDALDAEIGQRIAELVPDGAVLQLGIGTIPGAAAAALVARGVRDLTLISTLTDEARQLIEAGCCRTANPKAFVGDIIGSNALYRWVDRNEAIALTDAFDTHTIESFVRRPGLFCINSALEVDLLGQVNCETLGGRQAGSMGGAVDFAVAGQGVGNRMVIGLRSTTNKGHARIVPQLDSHIVSISRTFVETVVTEHGVAHLRNKSVPERAFALAATAHPDHRESLLAEAAKLR